MSKQLRLYKICILLPFSTILELFLESFLHQLLSLWSWKQRCLPRTQLHLYEGECREDDLNCIKESAEMCASCMQFVQLECETSLQAKKAALQRLDTSEEVETDDMVCQGNASLRKAEASLDAAVNATPAQRRIKIAEARKHLGAARLFFVDCGAEVEEKQKPMVDKVANRIREADVSAQGAMGGHEALAEAHNALEQERWGKFAEACDQAQEAFEDMGEIDQVWTEVRASAFCR